MVEFELVGVARSLEEEVEIERLTVGFRFLNVEDLVNLIREQDMVNRRMGLEEEDKTKQQQQPILSL